MKARIWLAAMAIALTVACETAPVVVPTPARSESPSASTEPPSTTATPPPATIPPTATPCNANVSPLIPVLVFQNGNIDLGVRFALGSVSFFLAACRDIDSVRSKYGLGPASLVITQPSGVDDIATRYYRAAIPVGREAEYVTLLAAHPDDFQYVEFDMIAHPCLIAASGCHTQSTIKPNEGVAGTSFTMTLCCWPEGTRVTKTFTTPSGRTITIQDVARANETVPAGWGGDPSDERGRYTVFVRDDKMGSLLRFVVR